MEAQFKVKESGAPEAKQEVAFAVDQVSVVPFVIRTSVADAAKETVVAGGGPPPPQDEIKTVTTNTENR